MAKTASSTPPPDGRRGTLGACLEQLTVRIRVSSAFHPRKDATWATADPLDEVQAAGMHRGRVWEPHVHNDLLPWSQRARHVRGAVGDHVPTWGAGLDAYFNVTAAAGNWPPARSSKSTPESPPRSGVNPWSGLAPGSGGAPQASELPSVTSFD